MVHKHELNELTMARSLNKASVLLEFIEFCLSSICANILTIFYCCHLFYFLLSNLSKILHVGFFARQYILNLYSKMVKRSGGQINSF